jgi:hypothetical protein
MAPHEPTRVRTEGGMHNSGTVRARSVVGRDQITNRWTDNSRVDTGGGAHVGGDVIAHNFVGGHNINVDLGPRYTLRRTGRILLVLGWLMNFAGFALFGYPVLRFILTIATAVTESSNSDEPHPPDLSQVAFVPYLPLGFGLLVCGMFVASSGALFVRRSRRAGTADHD